MLYRPAFAEFSVLKSITENFKLFTLMIHVSGFNNGVGGSPGATSAEGSGLRKPRPRSVYTSEQIQHFETFFRINEYIDGERKRKLSQLTSDYHT